MGKNLSSKVRDVLKHYKPVHSYSTACLDPVPSLLCTRSAHKIRSSYIGTSPKSAFTLLVVSLYNSDLLKVAIKVYIDDTEPKLNYRY